MEDTRPYWKVIVSLAFSLIGTILFIVIRNKIVVVFYAICHRVVYCIYCEPACVLAGKAVKIVKKARVGQLLSLQFLAWSSQCTVLWNQ